MVTRLSPVVWTMVEQFAGGTVEIGGKNGGFCVTRICEKTTNGKPGAKVKMSSSEKKLRKIT